MHMIYDTVLGKKLSPGGFLAINRDYGHFRYQDRWKWILPASRTFLNPPEPQGKANNLSYGTQPRAEKIKEQILSSLHIYIYTYTLYSALLGRLFYRLPYVSLLSSDSELTTKNELAGANANRRGRQRHSTKWRQLPTYYQLPLVIGAVSWSPSSICGHVYPSDGYLAELHFMCTYHRTYIYIYIYIHTYIRMYIYVYIYIHTWIRTYNIMM